MKAGPLILAGGAEFDARMAEADRAWLAARGIEQPRLGVFPTANVHHPDLAAANGISHFRTLGAKAEAVMAISRQTAEDQRPMAQVGTLDFAYFAGGEPLHLAETLAGSTVWQALVKRWRDGMGLGGSSAGAMVMCEAVFVQARWAGGLSVLPGAVLRPHFNRQDEAAAEAQRAAITARNLIGIGIDESTALVWSADAGWRVAGQGSVWLLTPEGIARYTSGAQPRGLPGPAAVAP